MRIEEYDPELLASILARVTSEGLLYGSDKYESLLSPCLSVLENGDIDEITADLSSAWNLYDSLSKLYQEIKLVDKEHWLVKMCQNGLTQEEIVIQDLIIKADKIPRYTRLDYISLGQNRKIAEVQWRSGGPGLLLGISEVFAEELHKNSKLEFEKFELVNEFAKVLFKPQLNFVSDDYVVTNDISLPWLPGEKYLQRHTAFGRFRYVPIVRDDVRERIKLIDNQLYCKVDSKAFKINFMHGHDFIKHFEPKYLKVLVDEILSDQIWVETPLNFIYRQKWCMALPFLKEFSSYFDENLKSVLCPTILLNLNNPDFSLIADAIQSEKSFLLRNIKTIEDLIELPGILRSNLILKCGAGQGNFHTKSKGVFRLAGSRNYVSKIINLVKERMQTLDEPWLLQPYIDVKADIPFVNPNSLDDLYRIQAHSRYMIFGSKLNEIDKPKIMGGLGNFGKYWKVTGRSNSGKDDTKLWGASFVPLVYRVN